MSRVHVIEREEDESEINLTPMLDVVFIMLIFFIVTSTFVREIGVPAATTEPATIDSPDEENSIVVRIDDENEIWLDERRIDPAALQSHLVRLHAQDPEFPVVIMPARASTTRMLVRVIDSAMQANISDIAVAEASPAAR
jgi:biopolymer transport protein ExbD